MSYKVEVNNLSLNYKQFQALKNISFKLDDEKIYGLIGRNGAGKTSLLSLFASLREATEGSIKINGEIVFENYKMMQNVAFVYQKDYREEQTKAGKLIERAGRCRTNYDKEYTKYLINLFKLDIDKPTNKLSKGMQSVLDIIIGLSSRAPITIFDEAYLGMDAPTRVVFYQELLKDQEKHPRIMILSTHLVSEMDYLFDEVLIFHEGQLLVKEDYDILVSRGVTITGAVEEINEFAKNKKVIGEQRLGNTKAITLYEEQNNDIKREAQKKGFDIDNISLQDLFIYLTEKEV